MGDTRKSSQTTYGCTVECGVNFLFGLVRKQTKNMLKLLSLCVCSVACQEDGPKDSMVTYIIKTSLFDFIPNAKYIPKHVL